MDSPRPYYVFTRAELAEMLDSHIDMFLEYRDRHGRDEEAAKPCALSEMLEGLDAEHELWRLGECHTTHVREAERAMDKPQSRHSLGTELADQAAEIVRLQQVAAALTDVVSVQDKMLICYRTENFRHLGTYADRQLAAQERLRAALAGGDGAGESEVQPYILTAAAREELDRHMLAIASVLHHRRLWKTTWGAEIDGCKYTLKVTGYARKGCPRWEEDEAERRIVEAEGHTDA